MALAASFELIPTYTVTFTAGAGGTITGTANQVIREGSSSTAVTAVPDAGFRFVKWTKGGVDYSTDNPLTVANVTADMALTASFELRPTYTVTFSAGPGGTITGNLSQTIMEGDDCDMVTAVPDPGYTFLKWTDDAEFISTDNPLTVTGVVGDMNITVNFVPLDLDVKLYVKANPSDAGKVSFRSELHPEEESGSSIIVTDKAGKTLDIAAVAGDGYVFTRWTASTSSAYIADPEAASTTVLLQGDAVLTANFASTKVTSSLLVESSPAAGGTTVPAGPSVVNFGSVLSIAATPAAGYKFTGWEKKGDVKIQEQLQASTFATIGGDSALTAVFELDADIVDFTMSVAAASKDGGTVENPGTSSARINTARPVNATCNYGYVFDHWELVGLADIDNVYSQQAFVTPRGNVEVVAHFVKLSMDNIDLGRVYISTNNINMGTDRINIFKAGLLLDVVDPASDTISVIVEGNCFDINETNGRFIPYRWGWKYYSNDRKVSLALNLKGRYWNFSARGFTFAKFDNLDGTNILLKVNDKNFGANQILKERKHWSFNSGKDNSNGLDVAGNALDECSFNLASGVMNSSLRSRDVIWIASSIAAMPAGVKFDPASMGVSLCVDSFSVLVPAGSFRTLADGVYSFRDASTGMALILDLRKDFWHATLYDKDIWSRIKAEDGLDIYLQIGGYGGAEKIFPGLRGTYRNK